MQIKRTERTEYVVLEFYPESHERYVKHFSDQQVAQEYFSKSTAPYRLLIEMNEYKGKSRANIIKSLGVGI